MYTYDTGKAIKKNSQKDKNRKRKKEGEKTKLRQQSVLVCFRLPQWPLFSYLQSGDKKTKQTQSLFHFLVSSSPSPSIYFLSLDAHTHIYIYIHTQIVCIYIVSFLWMYKYWSDFFPFSFII